MDRSTRLPSLVPAETAALFGMAKSPARGIVTTSSRILARSSATMATPRRLLHTAPPTTEELGVVWAFLRQWVLHTIEVDAGAASIPGFGVVFIHVHAHGIRIPHFAVHPPFAARNTLKFQDVTALLPQHKVQHIEFREVAAHCRVDEYTAKSWLEHLLQNVGDKMRTEPLVELHLGVGTIVCKQRCVDGHMAQKQHGTIDPDIRPAEAVGKLGPKSLLATPLATYALASSESPLKPTAPGSPRTQLHNAGPRRGRAVAQASPRQMLQKRFAEANNVMPWHLSVKNQDTTLDCPELDATYPPLLDPFCRTLGVEQVDAVDKFASSDRIGSNYSLSAAQLVIRKHLPAPNAPALVFLHPASSADDDAELAALDIRFRPLSPPPHRAQLPLVTTAGKPVYSPLPVTAPAPLPTIDAATDDAAARYQYYLEHIISTKDIVPMNPLWTEHIQRLVARATQQLAPARAELIMRSMFQETLANYYFSIKKAVLDYLLLREGTQRRLQIPGGTPAMFQVQMKWKWGQGYAHAILPTRGWADRKILARDHLTTHLMVLDSHVLALHYLWGDFDHMLLVDLPTTAELAAGLVPMDVKAFEKRQLAQAAHVKRVLLEQWFAKTKRILVTAKNDEVLAAALEQPKHYFDCIAALMSLQLRGLVVRSIEAYVAFFQKHSTPGALKGLLLALVLDHNDIKFATPIDEAVAALLNVLFNIPSCFTHVDRVETKFEPSIILGGSPFLWGVGLHEEEVVRAADTIKSILDANIAHAVNLRANYAKYAMVASGDLALDAFMAALHDIPEYAAEIAKYMRFAMQISAEPSHGQGTPGLFHVDCSQLNQGLIKKASHFIQALFHAFSQVTLQRNMDIRQQFKLIVTRLSKKPVDLYELVDAEAYLGTLRSQDLPELYGSVQDVKRRIQFLIEQVELVPTCPVISGLAVASELLSSTAKTFEWKNQIEKVIHDGELALLNERTRIETTFIAKRSRFQAELEELESEVNSFQKKSDLRHATTYVAQLTKVRDAIGQARRTIDTISDEEAKLGWVQTDFLQLDVICETLEPYDQLWRTARDFREASVRWMRGNVFELDAKGNENAIHTMMSTLSNATKQLAETSPAAVSAAETLKKQIAEFRESIGLISVMGNPHLRDRHWTAIAETVGFVIDSTEHMTLQRLLDMGVQDHVQPLLDISEAATMEAEIERALDAMAEEWLHMEFQFVLVPASETFVLAEASVVDVHTKLDDHIVKTQAIRSSQYRKPFFGRAIAWERSLLKLRDIAELLADTGKVWAQIEPLFTAKADVPVLDKNSAEAKKFAVADGHWRTIMAAVVARPLCLAVIQIDKAADRLRECRALLEAVLQGLHACLELKRSLFARFYLISNTELITALSTPPDALVVRRASYLGRCFPGVVRLELNATKEVTSVSSLLDEAVALSQVVPTEKLATDVWLARLEQSLYTSMQVLLRSAMSDYSKKDFRKWVLLWPEQAVLVIERYMWTTRVESCLREPNSVADPLSLRAHKLADYIANELDPRLADLATELREGTHTLAHRVNLVTNVLVQLLQARDVTRELLRHEVHVIDADAFLWQSQLRVAWNDGSVLLKVMKATVLYGNEYLGNGPTVAVTPNTLKVARVLAVAMGIGKGTCVAGVAGAGKSTILATLAAACGKLCITHHCVEHGIVDDLARLVKGAAATGAWLSLVDAHNLAASATVGLVTDLLHRVQEATLQREASINLHGTKLRLRRGVHVAATVATAMPPTASAAFTALFRPVTLVAPDVQVIARVLCFLAGFTNHDLLGQRVAHTLHAANALFGAVEGALAVPPSLRLVKSVVDRAKKLVLKEHSYEVASAAQLVSIEDATIVQVLGDVLHNQIPQSDAAQHDLQELLRDLLPAAAPPSRPHVPMVPTDVVALALAHARAVASPAFVEKLHQLYTALTQNPCVVLTGAPQSGKTALYRAASHAHALLDERRDPYARRQSSKSGDGLELLQVVTPASMPLHEIFGLLLPPKAFEEGVLTLLLRRLHARSKLDAHARFWIVFDGSLSAAWTDGVQTLLGDHGFLGIATGEHLRLPPHARVLFETTDTANASPSVLTRAALVHVPATALSWRQLYDSWWRRQPDALKAFADVKDAIDGVVELVEPTLVFVRKHFRPAWCTSTELARVSSFLAILEASLRAALPKMATMTAKQLHSAGHCTFLLALVWGLGHTTVLDERVKFDAFLRGLAGEPVTAMTPAATTPTPTTPTAGASRHGKRFQLFFPSGRSELVHAFGLSVDWGLKWEPWVELVPSRLLPVPTPLRSIKELYVPTANTAAAIHFLELLAHGPTRHVGLVGGPETGKSAVLDAVCTQSLLRQRDSAAHPTLPGTVFVGLSCGTGATPSSLVTSLQDHLERSRKNVLSAPPGKTCLLLLDDVGVPELQGHGSKLELLRHLLGHGSIYEPKAHTECYVTGVSAVALLTERAKDRRLDPRFVAQLTLIGLVELSDADVSKLLMGVGGWFVTTRGLSVDFAQLLPTLVKATLRLFHAVADKFRVTPTRPQYGFKLVDMLRLLHGVCRDCPATQLADKSPMVRLWCHEASRQFQDRLMRAPDVAAFCSLLRDICSSSFAIPHEVLFPTLVAATAAANTVVHRSSDDMTTMGTHRSSMLGQQQVVPIAAYLHANFQRICFSSLPDHATYGEATPDFAAVLAPVVAAELAKLTDTPVRPHAVANDVVLTAPYVVEHIVRLVRLLRTVAAPASSFRPQHVLVLGRPGTGKSIMARVAGGLSGACVTYLSVQNPALQRRAPWIAKLKETLLGVVTAPKPSVVVVKHAVVGIDDDDYLQDMSVLISGHLMPTFVTATDIEGLAPTLREAALADNIFLDNQSQLEAYYLEYVARRFTLVVVLTMPATAPLAWQRHLHARYPGLWAKCHVHFVDVWPDEMFASLVRSGCMDAGMDDERAQLYIEAARTLFASAKAYETAACPLVPSRFVDHMSSFTRLWQARVIANEEKKAKLTAALDALRYLDKLSARVAQAVQGLTPEISRMSQVSKVINVGLQTESQALLTTAAQVQAEDEIRLAAEAKLADLQAAAAATLAEATGVVTDAIAKVRSLSAQDMAELCSLHPMPPPLRLLLECFCRLLGLEPVETYDERDIETKLMDYTLPAKKWLLRPEALDELGQLDTTFASGLDADVLGAAAGFYEHVEFLPGLMAKLHPSGGALCSWARACIHFKQTQVLLMPQWEHIRSEQLLVDACASKCAKLKHDLEAQTAAMQLTTTNRASTAVQVRELTTKLSDSTESAEKAQSLLAALAVFVASWNQRKDDCIEWSSRIPAHVLMATGLLSYAGHVPAFGRHQLLITWIKELAELGLPSSAGLLTQTSHHASYDILLDARTFKRWLAKSVPPDDPISHENVAFLTASETFPLVIDPHGVAFQWVLAMTTDVYTNESPLRLRSHTTDDWAMAQDELFAALQAQRTVLVPHMSAATKAVVLPVLLAKRQHSRLGHGRPNFLTYREALVDFDPDWRLYLFTTDEAAPWLAALASVTTPVYVEVTPQVCGELFRAQYLCNSSKHTLLHWHELKSSLHAAEHDAEEWEELCLSALAKSEASHAILDDTVALLTWRHSYGDAISKQLQLTHELRKVQRLPPGIDVVRQRFVDLCLINDDVRHIAPAGCVSLAWLQQLLTAILNAVGKDDAMGLLERITLTVYRTLHWSIPATERTLFNLLVALRLYQPPEDEEDDEGDASGSDHGSDDEGDADAGGDGNGDGDDRSDDDAAELELLEERGRPSWAWLCASQAEFRFLVAPPPRPPLALPLTCPSWLPWPSRWETLCAFCFCLPKALRRQLVASVQSDDKVVWKAFVDAAKTWLMELPLALTPLQRLGIVRALRPDQLGGEVLAFVHSVVPSEWLVATYGWSVGDMAAVGSFATPLVVATAASGEDVVGRIQQAGAAVKADVVLALHHEPLDKLLGAAMKTGQWLILRQADANPAWLAVIDAAYSALDAAGVHWEFRLWLCVEATAALPLRLLQTSLVRLHGAGPSFREHLFACAFQLHGAPALAAPGTSFRRASLTAEVVDPEGVDGLGSPTLGSPEWLSLCFLHALLVGRRQFAGLGFKSPVDIAAVDFELIVQEPHVNLDGHVYGANVRSPWDAALVRALVEKYHSGQLKPRLQRIIFAWSSPVERTASVRNLLRRRSSSITASDMEGVLDSLEAPDAGPLVPSNITSLPILDNPQWFNLPTPLVPALYAKETRDITRALESAFGPWIRRQFPPPEAAPAGPTRVDVLQYTALDKALDAATLSVLGVQKAFPLAPEAPLHAVLHAEVEGYDRIRQALRADIYLLQEALVDALGVMPPALDAMHAAVLRNETPVRWLLLAHSTHTSWTAFQAHLLRRIKFFDEWATLGAPPDIHWLGAYLYPTRFLHAITQHFARVAKTPLHATALHVAVVDDVDRNAPGPSVYVDGLRVVGGLWGARGIEATTAEAACSDALLMRLTPMTIPPFELLLDPCEPRSKTRLPVPLMHEVLSTDAVLQLEMLLLMYLPSALSATELLERGVYIGMCEAP
ncbi:hypothetical protein ACHHYP_11996 [Achlya hypogyna]|uniref:AAA+ ATPase domain-containing protein n=1 Tax=Achlya hypogyna TaxID=1202772 RepID=A0A1V9YHV8_ACHHY|nr:hypothetical protein ACHHYP_11996 [Achlya hypogyna]